MWSRASAQRAAEPRTVVGRWLLATLLNQSGERNRLQPMLNGGKSGWNYDEPGVIEAACEIAARRFFPHDVDIRKVTAFVSELRTTIHSVTPPGQLESEALVRLALGDPDVVIKDISSNDMILIQGTITLLVVRKLELQPSDVRQLVVAAERLGFERGWNPPLYA